MYVFNIIVLSTKLLGVIQQLPGSNVTIYRIDKICAFYIIPTLCHMTKHGLSTDPLSPSSCPRSHGMNPLQDHAFLMTETNC